MPASLPVPEGVANSLLASIRPRMTMSWAAKVRRLRVPNSDRTQPPSTICRPLSLASAATPKPGEASVSPLIPSAPTPPAPLTDPTAPHSPTLYPPS